MTTSLTELPRLVLYNVFAHLPKEDAETLFEVSSFFKAEDFCELFAVQFMARDFLKKKRVFQVIRIYEQVLLNLDLSESCILQDERITDRDIEEVVRTCPNLQSLSLSGCLNLTDRSLELLSNLKKLNTLNLTLLKKTTSTGLQSLGMCHRLRTLDLSGCKGVTDALISCIVKGCPHLESLTLDTCLDLTNNSLEVVVEELKELKFLDVSHLTKATKVGLEKIKKTGDLMGLVVCDNSL